MKRVQSRRVLASLFTVILLVLPAHDNDNGFAQSPGNTSLRVSSPSGRPVTIPVTVRVKGRTAPSELEPQMVDLTVSEDGEAQTLLSIRSWTNAPINLIVLIQDDVVSSVGLEIKPLSEFVRRLPRGSRILVGYLRAGSLQVRHKFTADLDRAAKSLRPPIGVASAAPYNPYVEVIERRSVAVYSFFVPTVTSSADGNLISQGQSSLNRLSDETGGRAFFQGLGAPTSFDPFIKELNLTLEKQIALTYLSTHPRNGFHRIKIISSTPDVDLNYPAGYTRK
jgi:hypothetical protein